MSSPVYEWKQVGGSTLRITFPVHDGCKEDDVAVYFGDNRLRLGIKGKLPIVSGELYERIDSSNGARSTVAKGECTVEVFCPGMSKWPTLLKRDTFDALLKAHPQGLITVLRAADAKKGTDQVSVKVCDILGVHEFVEKDMSSPLSTNMLRIERLIPAADPIVTGKVPAAVGRALTEGETVQLADALNTVRHQSMALVNGKSMFAFLQGEYLYFFAKEIRNVTDDVLKQAGTKSRRTLQGDCELTQKENCADEVDLMYPVVEEKRLVINFKLKSSTEARAWRDAFQRSINRLAWEKEWMAAITEEAKARPPIKEFTEADSLSAKKAAQTTPKAAAPAAKAAAPPAATSGDPKVDNLKRLLSEKLREQQARFRGFNSAQGWTKLQDQDLLELAKTMSAMCKKMEHIDPPSHLAEFDKTKGNSKTEKLHLMIQHLLQLFDYKVEHMLSKELPEANDVDSVRAKALLGNQVMALGRSFDERVPAAAALLSTSAAVSNGSTAKSYSDDVAAAIKAAAAAALAEEDAAAAAEEAERRRAETREEDEKRAREEAAAEEQRKLEQDKERAAAVKEMQATIKTRKARVATVKAENVASGAPYYRYVYDVVLSSLPDTTPLEVFQELCAHEKELCTDAASGKGVAGAGDQRDYTGLCELLGGDGESLALINALSSATGRGTVDETAVITAACRALDSYQLSVEACKRGIRGEVAGTQSAGTLFRSNSAATKLIKEYTKVKGKSYLIDTLRPLALELGESNETLEVDPSKLGDDVADKDATVKHNQEMLRKWAARFFDAITGVVDRAPAAFRELARYLQSEVEPRFPTAKYSCLGGFLFLRFFCPAVMSPFQYGVTEKPQAKTTVRALLLISKLLQNVANGAEFKKEVFMRPFNEFVTDYQWGLASFFDKYVAAPADWAEQDRANPIATREQTGKQDLPQLHWFLQQHTNLGKVVKAMSQYRELEAVPRLARELAKMGPIRADPKPAVVEMDDMDDDEDEARDMGALKNVAASVAVRDSTKCGWLMKQGGSHKSWKKRWFVLSGDLLYYYEKESSKEAKGIIEIDKSTEVIEVKIEGRDNSFGIKKTERTYHIAASSSDEKVDWVRVLVETQSAIAKRKAIGAQNPAVKSLMQLDTRDRQGSLRGGSSPVELQMQVTALKSQRKAAEAELEKVKAAIVEEQIKLESLTSKVKVQQKQLDSMADQFLKEAKKAEQMENRLKKARASSRASSTRGPSKLALSGTNKRLSVDAGELDQVMNSLSPRVVVGIVEQQSDPIGNQIEELKVRKEALEANVMMLKETDDSAHSDVITALQQEMAGVDEKIRVLREKKAGSSPLLTRARSDSSWASHSPRGTSLSRRASMIVEGEKAPDDARKSLKTLLEQYQDKPSQLHDLVVLARQYEIGLGGGDNTPVMGRRNSIVKRE